MLQERESSFGFLKKTNFSILHYFKLLSFYMIANKLPEPPLPFGEASMRIRSFLTQSLFKRQGYDVKIHGNIFFGSGVSIEIGNYSNINIGCWLSNDTVIGNDVMLGPYLFIISATHGHSSINDTMRSQGMLKSKPVIIGDDVWIGAKSILLPGVNIGSHSIVGAGSVVTKSFPEFSVIAGNPAKLIRTRA